MFDSSVAMAEAAARGLGVALLPAMMFGKDLKRKRLVRPFKAEVVPGAYRLTSQRSKRPSAAMETFRAWLLTEAASVKPGTGQDLP